MADRIYVGKLALIAAYGRNHELGFQGDLLWRHRADLKRFRELTLGHVVIMGRKTWDSIGQKPLPKRGVHIVLSRQGSALSNADGTVLGMSSWNEVFTYLRQTGVSFACVLGGTDVYEKALPFATDLYLTKFDVVAPHADTFFPAWNESEWRLVREEILPSGEGEPKATFQVFERL